MVRYSKMDHVYIKIKMLYKCFSHGRFAAAKHLRKIFTLHVTTTLTGYPSGFNPLMADLF